MIVLMIDFWQNKVLLNGYCVIEKKAQKNIYQRRVTPHPLTAITN